ncbi:hypothetical protein EX30DRAFT_287935, partial [Ascodesmis nigricans]
RSRSHRDHHDHRSRRSHKRSPTPPPVSLPFSARPLSRHDFDLITPIFASYLDVQKCLELDALDPVEQKGRFKSFVKHYNRGELARGWYERVVKELGKPTSTSTPAGGGTQREGGIIPAEEEESESDDEVGPPIPGQERKPQRPGPDRPGFDDLELQRAYEEEERHNRVADIRYERRMDKKAQKEALDELIPRAEPGTHERKLEKKRELNDKLRAFREKSPGVGDEVDEGTLMGDGNDEFKARKAALQRKKNDRELRREQILQARIAEREERLREHREKEERTMEMLRSLAKRRF